MLETYFCPAAGHHKSTGHPASALDFSAAAHPPPASTANLRAIAKPKPKSAAPAKKLSFKEQREYDGMEAAILETEEALETARAALADPAVASDGHELARRLEAVQTAEAEVARLYARWEELAAKIA